jgi:hypothetical protein
VTLLVQYAHQLGGSNEEKYRKAEADNGVNDAVDHDHDGYWHTCHGDQSTCDAESDFNAEKNNNHDNEGDLESTQHLIDVQRHAVHNIVPI